MKFIPARESRFFITLFRWYTYLLFKRRFHAVWIGQRYQPNNQDKTIYYLNHHSWWDGLIPFLLNEFRFHQKARAFMEDRHLLRYSFFSKIGVFSIDPKGTRGTIKSMRYALQSMERENASLFIYPEGEITTAGSPVSFRGGLAWLYSKLNREDIDFVPIAIYIHNKYHGKPELVIHVGEPTTPDPGMPLENTSAFFEKQLQQLIDETTASASKEGGTFERFV